MGFLHQLHLLLWKNISLKRRGPVRQDICSCVALKWSQNETCVVTLCRVSEERRASVQPAPQLRVIPWLILEAPASVCKCYHQTWKTAVSWIMITTACGFSTGVLLGTGRLFSVSIESNRLLLVDKQQLCVNPVYFGEACLWHVRTGCAAWNDVRKKWFFSRQDINSDFLLNTTGADYCSDVCMKYLKG